MKNTERPLAQDLAQLLLTCGMKDFEDGVKELQFLKRIWKRVYVRTCTCMYVMYVCMTTTIYSYASFFLVLQDVGNITLVKMPPKMCKRGRPKGAGLTGIGLPKKKENY